MMRRPGTHRMQIRLLMRDLTEAVRKRFGEHRGVKIWVDTSDGDPGKFDACLQHPNGPGPEGDWLLFPRSGGIPCGDTKEEALELLLVSVQDSTHNSGG